MTAQFSDTVRYQNQDFFIAGVNGEGLFSPQEHGLKPTMMSTACYRGFVCWYSVENDLLQLQKLWIRHDQPLTQTKYGRGPILFDVEPTYIENEGCSSYENVHELVTFTGGLLIGRDFISTLYVHMGFHPAWKFREVHELLFIEGELLEARDLSKRMQTFRDKIGNKPIEPRSSRSTDIKKWVAECFDLDYQLPF